MPVRKRKDVHEVLLCFRMTRNDGDRVTMLVDREMLVDGQHAIPDDAVMAKRGHGSVGWCDRRFAKQLLARLLSGGVSFLCGACEDPDAFDELTDEYRLSAIGPNVLVTPSPNSNAGLETSAVGFPSTNRLFVSYNSQESEPSCGWSYSTNGGGSFTSTDHVSTPLPGFLGSDGSAFTKCLGDTWSVDVSHSVGSPMVAMVAVTKHAGSGGCNSSWYDVGMWTGAPNAFPTPGNVLLLSDQLGSGGCTDGPKIGWDPTNHKAWVWWWDDGRTFLRPVAVLNNGTMIPGATIELTGELMADEKHATIAIMPGAGGGAPPWIMLSYPTIVGDDDLKPCDINGNHLSTAVTWWLSRSINDGADWTHLQIDHDPAWPFCLSDTPLGGNRAIVSPIWEPNSGRLMLSYSRHIDDENGDFVGTRVVTKMWPNKNGNVNAFTTWIPICNPDVCPNPPPTGKSCLVNGAPPAGESVCHQYGPGVGVKASGTRRFATVFHDTRDSDDFGFPNPDVGETTVNPLLSDVWGYSIRAGNLAGNEYTIDRITPLVGNVPWAETSMDGNLWWGDYEDGVVGFGSRFHAIWADDRDAGDDTTKLMGAAFNE